MVQFTVASAPSSPVQGPSALDPGGHDNILQQVYTLGITD